MCSEYFCESCASLMPRIGRWQLQLERGKHGRMWQMLIFSRYETFLVTRVLLTVTPLTSVKLKELRVGHLVEILID